VMKKKVNEKPSAKWKGKGKGRLPSSMVELSNKYARHALHILNQESHANVKGGTIETTLIKVDQ
jgi:hypothetical protein